MKMVRQGAGYSILATGLFFLPLPIPLGLPLIALGLAVLGPDSPPIRRAIRWLRARSARANDFLERHKDRLPPFVRRYFDDHEDHDDQRGAD